MYTIENDKSLTLENSKLLSYYETPDIDAMALIYPRLKGHGSYLKIIDDTKLGINKTHSEYALIDLAESCKSGFLEYVTYNIEQVVDLAEYKDSVLFTFHNNNESGILGTAKLFVWTE